MCLSVAKVLNLLGRLSKNAQNVSYKNGFIPAAVAFSVFFAFASR